MYLPNSLQIRTLQYYYILCFLPVTLCDIYYFGKGIGKNDNVYLNDYNIVDTVVQKYNINRL